MNKTLSSEKLIAYLKSAKIGISSTDTDIRYMYGTGRNVMIDILLANIYMGDFDEV